MSDELNPKDLRKLADEIEAKAKATAARMNSAYDWYGMNNTPEDADPIGMRCVDLFRRVANMLEAEGKL